jgi:5'-nucleotidase (lipoprotein e(P4) family)
MKTRSGWTAAVAALTLAACAPAARVETASPGIVPGAVHWTRSAAEHRAIFLQTYRAAAEALRGPSEGRTPGSWGVILDADETVLDNSLFQLRLARSGRSYDERIWNDWVREEAAPALPGAVEFVSLVRDLGGRVAIVTNREMVVCDETRRNLAAVGVHADAVLCRDETGDKNPRFDAVIRGEGTGMPPIDVVLWVGDNIGDFPGGSQALKTAPPGALEAVGRRWFVLPNPMYGSWESVPVTDHDRDALSASSLAGDRAGGG